MSARARRCALAALALSVATRAAASHETWPFPEDAAIYVGARAGPVMPRGTFAPGVVGIEGEFAAGAWYREVVAIELAAGVSWTSGRERTAAGGAPAGSRDGVLTYLVDASLKVAPGRLRAPYLLVGLGRYAFSFTRRVDGNEVASGLGDYIAPHFGVGYLHRVARRAVAMAELRYVPAHAEVAGAREDLSAFQLSVGLAYP